MDGEEKGDSRSRGLTPARFCLPKKVEERTRKKKKRRVVLGARVRGMREEEEGKDTWSERKG